MDLETNEQTISSTRKLRRIYTFIGLGIFTFNLILIIIYMCNNDEESLAFENYLKSKKSLYVWGYIKADNFIKFLIDHNFSKIYLYVGCIQWDLDKLKSGNFYNTGDIEPKELLKTLNENNIEVYLSICLNDEVDNFTNVEKILEVCQTLGDLQETLNFTALHLELIPNNASNFEQILQIYESCTQFISVSASLKESWLNVKMPELKNAFTSEDFYEKFKDCETFIDAIMTVTNYTAIMAYSNTYEGVDNILEQFDIIRKRHHSNIATPILEINDKISDGLFLKYIENKAHFFHYFTNMTKKFNEVTIHCYEPWYRDLYCKNPNEKYISGRPKNC